MTDFKFLNQYDVNVQQFCPRHDHDLKITLILLPAIGVPIKKYYQFINMLNDVGFTVLTADYPCCGENTPHINKGINYNYRDLVDGFIRQLVDFSTTERTILLGHSLGAHLATLYATENNIEVIGIATGNVYYKNWSGLERLKILNAVLIFQSLSIFYGYLPGYKIGFANKEAKGVIQNWCYTALTGKYDYFSSDLKCAKMKGYFIHIDGDKFAPLKSTLALAALFHDCVVEQVRLPQYLKGNQHSVWLKEPDIIVNRILEKLTQDRTKKV